ncbi:YlxR family protein [Desulfoferrobacter suflitae]|uniref:YlxR family protein n=1 Tax=Desulfoferrobacter suflitae TaxID=2865782 RepID=UPI00338ECCB5
MCSGRKPKAELVRLAINCDKLIVVDYNQGLGGRGAYACSDCLPRLRFTGRVQRAFRNQARGLAINLLPQPSILPNHGTREDSEERRPRCERRLNRTTRGKF